MNILQIYVKKFKSKSEMFENLEYLFENIIYLILIYYNFS